MRPVTAGRQSVRGMWLASWHLISATSIVVAVPPVLVFVLIQRQFITGLTGSAGED